MNGLNLNESLLLERYRKAKDIEIERLLTQYGTSLKDMREMYPQLTGAVQQRQLTTAFPAQPMFFTPTEAAQMGLGLQEGWMLKMTPIEGNGGFTSSFITPQKWEVTEDDLYISPAGEQYSRADLEALMAVPAGLEEVVPPTGPMTAQNLTEEGQALYGEYQETGGELGVEDWVNLRERQQLETEQVFGAVFPEQDITEIAAYIESDPEGFLADLREIGRTEETEALLRILAPEITDEDIAMLFEGIAGVEWVTPETLGLPEPSPMETGWARSHTWFLSPVRTEQQLIVLDIIHRGLLASEFIPDYQKEIIEPDISLSFFVHRKSKLKKPSKHSVLRRLFLFS